MKITIELTPEEIGESIVAFGIDALVSNIFYSWFGFDQFKGIEIERVGKKEELSQLLHGFISETLDHLELFGTCDITLKDGRVVDSLDLDDMLDELGTGYDRMKIAEKVQGAKVIIEFSADDKSVTATVIE